jgi:hypothetical protein
MHWVLFILPSQCWYQNSAIIQSSELRPNVEKSSLNLFTLLRNHKSFTFFTSPCFSLSAFSLYQKNERHRMEPSELNTVHLFLPVINVVPLTIPFAFLPYSHALPLTWTLCFAVTLIYTLSITPNLSFSLCLWRLQNDNEVHGSRSLYSWLPCSTINQYATGQCDVQRTFTVEQLKSILDLSILSTTAHCTMELEHETNWRTFVFATSWKCIITCLNCTRLW